MTGEDEVDEMPSEMRWWRMWLMMVGVMNAVGKLVAQLYRIWSNQSVNQSIRGTDTITLHYITEAGNQQHFSGGGKDQIWGGSCLHYHAYRKMIAGKMVFVRFGGWRQRTHWGNCHRP